MTAMVFGAVAYFTVSNELSANLDASLLRAAASLQAVIKREQADAQKPLSQLRREQKSRQADDVFAFLQRSSMRDFVGPIPVPDSVFVPREDPVWTAVYEHVLLNSSTYVLQASAPDGDVVWRSDNLLTDSLPRFEWFKARGMHGKDGQIFSDYTVRGTRYRLVIVSGDAAEVAAAYPVEEVDDTLRSLFSVMLYSIPVLIVVSILLGWFLARRALKPVDMIAKKAQRITAERLSERLPLVQTNDEIARLTAILNEMIARLERSFEQVRQFTADASHELKTPLAILMGELEVALRKEIADDDVRHTLESCLEEVERLTAVVQGLLDLSRAETGQLELITQPMDLSGFVREICEDVEILAEPKNITVQTRVDNAVRINGDRVRLHQALLNVIENAIKYTPAGGSVEVRLEARGTMANLVVRDTGVGIPADQLPRIYDRFYRVDKARSKDVQGTGLGLAIVKWVVESHQGSITVQSDVGQGTTFTLSFPMLPMPAPAP